MELLAPAGNMACLHAAVRAGADAVYLGVDRFNARRGADNFTMETLREACDYAHLRGVRIYLTVNIAILPSEAQAAMEVVRQGYRAGVDAFIVQDLGLAAEMRRTLPEADLHVSTQMNVLNAAGVEAAAKLGASRVTFARELELAEVAELSALAAERGMDTEVFGHGAICICYSGQCYMSSLVGGRSANRGMCAQACRLPYELHNKAVKKALPSEGEHLLSPKDLCTVDLIPELAVAGVGSLKIEGRMKSPEYVQAVVGVYRDVLDRTQAWLAAQPEGADLPAVPQSLRATEEEHRVLSEAFSRGFTQAYLTHDDGNQMMSYGRPNNRGVFVGRVASVRAGSVLVHAEEELVAGDVLEFWTNRGHFAHTLAEGDLLANGDARIALTRKVGPGDRVFRVRSAKAAFKDDALAPKVPVQGKAVLRIGEPLRFELVASDGSFGSAEGPVVEAARTKAVAEDEVRAHLDRFGNEPFALSRLDVELDDGVGIGFSQLHKVRAQASRALEDDLLAAYHDRILPKAPKAPQRARVGRGGSIVIAAWATNAACARAAKKAGADVVYVPAVNYKRGESLVAGQISSTVAQAGYPNKAVIALPVADHDLVPGTREARFDFDAWRYVRAEKPVFAESFAQLWRAKEMGARPEVGPHVPAFNAWAVNLLEDWGAERVWLSPELTLGQIEQIGASTTAELGITVYGSTEMMTTEHCLLMSQGACDRNCTDCARRKSPHYLKDRKDYEMPVFTDCCGRSHLYNAVPLDIVHTLPDLIAAGVRAFMVDATLLNTAETTDAVARLVRARNIAQKGNTVQKLPGTTTGHLFRSVQ